MSEILSGLLTWFRDPRSPSPLGEVFNNSSSLAESPEVVKSCMAPVSSYVRSAPYLAPVRERELSTISWRTTPKSRFSEMRRVA